MNIRQVHSKKEYLEVADLISKIFGQGMPGDPRDYFGSMDYWRKVAPKYPGFSWENLWIAEDRRKIIGNVMVSPREIKISRAVLRLGGLGVVLTHPARRKQGVASLLINSCIDYMREEGYDLSGLFGIPNFYPRFGFATSLMETGLLIDTSRLAKLRKRWPVRRWRPGDLADMEKLHTANSTGLVGGIVRSDAYWLSRRQRLKDFWVTTGEDGQVRGYIWLSKRKVKLSPEGTRLLVSEVAVDTSSQAATIAASDSLLWFLAREASANRIPRIEIPAPLDHPFVAHGFYEYSGTRYAETAKDAEGMIRIINLGTTFEKLQNLLSDRLHTSAYRDWTGNMAIQTDLGTAELAVEKGKLTIKHSETPAQPLKKVLDPPPAQGQITCRIPQNRLAQLIMGHTPVARVATDPAVSIPDDALPVLSTLFPPGHPFIWHIDRF